MLYAVRFPGRSRIKARLWTQNEVVADATPSMVWAVGKRISAVVDWAYSKGITVELLPESYLAVGVRNHDGFEQPQQMLDYMIDCLQSIAGE